MVNLINSYICWNPDLLKYLAVFLIMKHVRPTVDVSICRLFSKSDGWSPYSFVAYERLPLATSQYGLWSLASAVYAVAWFLSGWHLHASNDSERCLGFEIFLGYSWNTKWLGHNCDGTRGIVFFFSFRKSAVGWMLVSWFVMRSCMVRLE